MSEESFWRSTPKKVGTLWDIHADFNGWTNKDEEEERVYIDQIPFF